MGHLCETPAEHGLPGGRMISLEIEYISIYLQEMPKEKNIIL
jgi:hypothetical protein